MISGSPSPSPYSESDRELYDYVSDDAWAGEQGRQIIPPSFTSTPQTFLVDEGDTVRLPCLVDRLEGFVMLWKKESEIVTVAEQIIDQVRNVKEMKYLKKNLNFQLEEGKYQLIIQFSLDFLNLT